MLFFSGMCLYNAVSLYLTGSEEQALLLRSHVAIHYLLNHEVILQAVKGKKWEHTCQHEDVNLLAAFRESEYSDMIMVYALSHFLERPIETYMVDCPKSRALNPSMFRDKLGAEFESSENKSIKIMWTGWYPYNDENFAFNHFVPLVPLIDREGSDYYEDVDETKEDNNGDDLSDIDDSDDDDDDDEDFLGYETQDEAANVQREIAKKINASNPAEGEKTIAEKVQESKHVKRKKVTNRSIHKTSKAIDKMLTSTLRQHMKPKKVQLTGDEELDMLLEQLDSPFKLLTIPTAIRWANKIKPIKKLPLGPKCNSRYLVCNKYNLGQFKKRKAGQKIVHKSQMATYSCDLGQYTQKQHFTVYVRMHDDVFQVRKDITYVNNCFKVKHAGTMPNMQDVILVRTVKHRHNSGQFVRQTTEFLMAPDDLPQLTEKMVVEYLGNTTDAAMPHGNSITNPHDYMATGKLQINKFHCHLGIFGSPGPMIAE